MPCEAHAIVTAPITEVSLGTVNEAPSLQPVASLGHTQSLPSNVASTDDTNELAIADVDSSLSFSSSIVLSRPMAPLCHTESVQASLASTYDTDDTDELPIDVHSSLSFSSSIELSRSMASLGLNLLLLGYLAGGDDFDESTINEADCSFSVVSSTIISRHEALVGLTQTAALISESDNSSRVDERGKEHTRRA